MNIDHLFFCREDWFIEYANKIYEYCNSIDFKNMYYCIHKKSFKYAKMPKEKILTINMLKNSDYEVKNLYGNYFEYTSEGCVKSFKNVKIHKISYGFGNDDWFYSNCRWGNEKRTIEYLGGCDYETHKFFTRKNNHIEKFRTIGLIKYDQTIHYDKEQEISKINFQQSTLEDIYFDKNKPTILFLHTWDKANETENSFKTRGFQGISNYEETAKQLKKLSNEFNIIHKNHHQTSNIFSDFLNIENGTVDSKFLFDIADIIISDYGGSALEALLSDKKIIYVDDYNHDKISHLNIDARIHHSFDHCYPEDILKHIDIPMTKEQEELRLELRNYFYGESLDKPCEKFIKCIKDPNYKLFDEKKFLDNEITKKYNLGWKTKDITKVLK